MKIHLATWLEEPSQAIALNNAGALNRLLSYYFLSKRPQIDEEIKKYGNISRRNTRNCIQRKTTN